VLENSGRIERTVFQEKAFQSRQRRGTAERTDLCVLVEDSRSIFDTRTDMVLQEAAPVRRLVRAARARPAKFQGSLRIHACPDTTCRPNWRARPPLRRTDWDALNLHLNLDG
jgi:hypothetical protein